MNFIHTCYTDALSCRGASASSVYRSLAFISMALALTIGLWLTRIGISQTDEPFHMLYAFNPYVDPLVPLTEWIGHWFGVTVGWRWWAFRLLGWIFCMGAIMVGSAYAGIRSGNKTSYWLLCALLLFLASIQGTFQMLWGWDAPTFFCTALAFVAWLNFRHHLSVPSFLLMVLSCVILGWVKVPNLAVAGIVPLLIMLIGKELTLLARIKWAVAFCLLYVVLSLLLLAVIYGAPQRYFDYLVQLKLSQGYTLWELLRGMLTSLFMSLEKAAMFGLVYIISRSLDKWQRGSASRISITALGYCFLTGMLLLWMTLCPASLLSYYTNGFFLLATGYLLCLKGKREKLLALSLLAFAFIPTLGSNTGVAKMSTFGLLPLVVWGIHGVKAQKWMLRATVCIIFAYTLHAGWYSANCSFGDVGFRKACAKVEAPAFDMLLTSPDQAAHLNQLNAVLAAAPEGPVLVLGEDNTRHIYEYLCMAPNRFAPGSYRMESDFDTPAYVDFTCSELHSTPGAKVLYVARPDRDMTRGSAMSLLLDSLMTRSWQSGRIILYIPNLVSRD